MKFIKLKSAMAACIMASLIVPNATYAKKHHDDEEIPFDVARIFFELNNTDGDLGIHAEIDGEEWKSLKIRDPRERQMLKIRVNGVLKKQGLTEIFFESAEPNFEDLSPETFFSRFPEGTYEVEGITLDGEEMESEYDISHVMPAPVEGVQISGEEAAIDCDMHQLPIVASPVVLSWEAVTSSHPDLGAEGPVEVEYYEVVVEIDDSPFKTVSLLPPDVTELTISDDFIALSDEFKFEILVRDVNGNKTAIESCFLID
jgi:hypothetical protein